MNTPSIRTPRAWQAELLRLVAVAVACGLAAWLTLKHVTDDGIVVPIWVSSGIAVAAVAVWGWRMLLAVATASLVVNGIVQDVGMVVSATLAGIDALEALIGALVIGSGVRMIGFTRVAPVVRLLVAAPVAAAVGATLGVALLDAVGALSTTFDRAWLRYWLSVVASIVIVTPLLVSWLQRGIARPAPSGQRLEAIALSLLLVTSTALTFAWGTWSFAKLLFVLPLLSWATARFGERGASASTAAFAGIAVWMIAANDVMLAGLGERGSEDVIQVLVTLIGGTNLLLAASLSERAMAELRLVEVVDTFDHAERLADSGTWEYRVEDRERVWCSRHLRRLLDLPAEPPGLLPISEVLAAFSERDRERLAAAVRRALSEGEPFRMEHRIPREGVDCVFVHVGDRVRPAHPDSPVRIVGSLMDVTHERAIEQFKDDLIATASHELRTPLTAILGFADTLDRRWDEVPEPSRRQYVHIIDEQARRLELIVSDTLLQSRVDAGTVHTERRRYLVGRCVRNAIAALSRDDVEIERDVQPGLMAIGDPMQLERVLDNLLTNAGKYGQPPYAVRGRRRGDQVELRVEDHGPGVPLSFRSRMFDRFARGPDVGTAPGTGLGLSIGRGLVEAMGGTLSYERWQGATSFVIRLPSADAAGDAEPPSVIDLGC